MAPGAAGRPKSQGTRNAAGLRPVMAHLLGHAPPVPGRTALLFVVAVLSLGITAEASAEPLPATLTSTAGPRSTHVEVAVSAEEADTRIRVGTGRHVSEVTVRGVTNDATIESVVTSGGRVAIVRATGDASIAAVIGVRGTTATILWSGRLDLRGDPGERWADVLDVSDHDGDGTLELVVGVRREGLALCGGELATSGTRALHDGALVGVELRPTFVGEATAITAVASLEGASAPPVVPALRFGVASSDAGSHDALTAGSPAGLTDGSSTTGWTEGRAGGGMGEVLAGRWSAPVPVRAFALRADAGHVLPSALSIVGDGGVRLAVTIPAELHDVAWIVPPSPLAWSCVSIVIEAAREGTSTTGFVEIEAYTDYDFGGGLGALVDELVADGEVGERATLWLSRAGEPALSLLVASWERLGALGRRRAIRVAAGAPLRDGSGARTILGSAAADEDAEVRADALIAMRRLRALDLLVAAAGASGPPGEEAAAMLAELPFEASLDVGPLLVALSSEGGAARPELRRAVARASTTGGDSVVSWSTTAAAPALAAAALAVSSRDDEAGHLLGAALLAAGTRSATDFPELYRLVRAAVLLGSASTPEIDGWLRTQVTGAETWMVRASAIEALGARADEATMAAALDDDYPRVRVAALDARLLHAEPGPVMARFAHDDPWPLVRIVALDAIATAPEGAAAARAALDDRVAGVRARALEILVARGDRDAWPAVEARLRDEDEWPEVSRAALRYVEAFCIDEAADALAGLIDTGAQEGAWAPDVETAIDALGVALRLGGDAATAGRRIAGRGTAAAAPLANVLDRAESFTSCHE